MDEARDVVQIESRLRAVDAVGGVIQALWAIARAQLPKAQAAVAESSVYLQWMDEALQRVLEPSPAAAPRDLFVVLIGPERPFCGGLPRELLAAGRDLRGSVAGIGLVGQRLVEAVRMDPDLSPLIRFGLPGPSSVDELEPTARALVAAVLTHARTNRVLLTHARATTASLQTTTLLPGDRRFRSELPDHYCKKEALVAAAVRESAAAHVQVALAEANFAEVRARIAAAEAARQSIDRQRDRLREAGRVVRHEQITSELIEIFAGRSAVTRGDGSLLRRPKKRAADSGARTNDP